MTTFQNLQQSVQPNIITLISLDLNTGKWYNNNHTTRVELLRILARPISVTITASAMSSSDFGYIVRIGGIRYKKFSISSTESTTASINNKTVAVEQCRCPVGYTGASCQHCTNGYYHHVTTNGQSRVRECRKCECHKHSAVCNKETGECIDCQDNTIGHQCELCKLGYYGNATDLSLSKGCTKCPCDAPNTRSDVCLQDPSSGNITCAECSIGYRGELCEKCKRGFFKERDAKGVEICTGCRCSNNTDVCSELDGTCIDCAFNTTGRNCHVCLHGWYGNAKNQTCSCK